MTPGRKARPGFVFEQAPFAQAHASSLAETIDGVICAFFAGSREGASDVGIWLARLEDGATWCPPELVARGADREGRPLPCWNPVLHRLPDGMLLLFWRVGPSPRRWWTLLARSADDGRSWSTPEPLREDCLGPIRSKPLARSDGCLLCPSSTEHLGWRCHMELFAPQGGHWQRGPALNAPWDFMAVQPALLDHGGGRFQALCRTRNRVIATTTSLDGGVTWSPMRRMGLPNPNSGIETLSLRSGLHLLVYNPVRRGRTPLTLAASKDGENWRDLAVLENDAGEYSYPAAIEDRHGRVHISWTWRRQRIRHLALPSTSLG